MELERRIAERGGPSEAEDEIGLPAYDHVMVDGRDS
jgi:hypothetical protein